MSIWCLLPNENLTATGFGQGKSVSFQLVSFAFFVYPLAFLTVILLGVLCASVVGIEGLKD